MEALFADGMGYRMLFVLVAWTVVLTVFFGVLRLRDNYDRRTTETPPRDVQYDRFYHIGYTDDEQRARERASLHAVEDEKKDSS